MLDVYVRQKYKIKKHKYKIKKLEKLPTLLILKKVDLKKTQIKPEKTPDKTEEADFFRVQIFCKPEKKM